MKTKIFLLIGAMLVSVMAFSQVEFKNSYTDKIIVTSLDGLNSVEIFPKETASTPFLKEVNGIVRAKIQRYSYRPGAGFAYINDGEFTLAVKNGVAVFNDPKQKQASSVSALSDKKLRWKTGTPLIQPAQTAKKATEFSGSRPQEVSPFAGMTSTFVVQNCCTMTITGYSGLLDGLCLKTKQTAKISVTAKTGLIQSAIGYDTDSDKVATGKNQKWAVLYKSIPEGLDTLKIYNENLVLVNTGVQVVKPFRNKTPLGYLITNGEDPGKNTGKVSDLTVAPISIRKMKFYLGWNVKVFQYLDENGLPRQAALLFMVTKDQRMVTLSKKSGTGNSISDKELKIE